MDEQTASTSKMTAASDAIQSSTTHNVIRSGGSSSGIVSNNSNSLSPINSEKNRKLLLTVYKYLQQQMNDNQTLTASQKESLEVAVHCLGYAFQFFEFDYVEHDLDKIFEFFEKHKHDRKKNEPEFEGTEVSPDDMAKANEYKEKGNKLMREDKFTEALEFYEKAVCLNPKEPALYCNRAAAYNNLNKFKEAVEDCNMAISLDGSYAKAYIRRALAYEKLKDNKHALKSYKKAYQLEPENERYKNLYMDASRRFKQRQDGSTSTSTSTAAGPSFNMFLGSGLLPDFDNLVESLYNVGDRQWQNQPSQNSSGEREDSYNYFS